MLHALNNFVADFSSGIWGQVTHLENLNNAGVSWISYIMLLIPAAILHRKGKMKEIILRRKKNIGQVSSLSFTTPPKAIASVLLGGASILIGWTGMFWSVGVMGVLAAKATKEQQNTKDKLANIGMILSFICTLLGIVCMIGIIIYFVSLGAYERYRLFLDIF